MTEQLAKKHLLEMVSVIKTFDIASGPVEVLHNVTFSVPVGSFTILFGPSGSGKSTILNTMIGIEPPTSGSVLINGVDLYSFTSDQRAKFRSQAIGMVHQDNYWVNSLSVLENIALPLYLSGWERPKAREYAMKSIRRIGLEQYAHYQPTVLSGGQQQRISFARATAKTPYILVADEPTGNLDTNNGNQIIELIKEYNIDYGSTVVLVTHNDEFLKYANNLLTIRDGQVNQKTGNIDKSSVAS